MRTERLFSHKIMKQISLRHTPVALVLVVLVLLGSTSVCAP
jgi:hypothetical protein